MTNKEELPKILFLDIEVAPNLATVWSIWNQNIGINQLIESSYTLCWAAKWRGSKTVMFDSVRKSGKRGVIKSIYKLLCECDIVIHYNGRKFDIPVLNRDFLLYKLTPPVPYKQVDLYHTVKKKFFFVSNKLDYVSKHLGFEGKIKTTHQLWLDCMNNDAKAWKKMESYNRRDVTELEKIYDRLLPWIDSHPNMGLYMGFPNRPTCTNCGSQRLSRRGTQTNRTLRYQRYCCANCGTWTRSRKSDNIKIGKNILTHVHE